MKQDTWIVMKKSAVETLWEQSHPALDSDGYPVIPIPVDALMLASAAVRGHWKDITDVGTVYETINVMRAFAEVESFKSVHAGDVLAAYGWTQGNGLDNDGTNAGDYPTVPQGVLDVMLDHIEYDDNGDVISTTPPTFDNPNWGHVFVGQTERIFAGQFSLEFSREFF